jgi:cell division septal protein FtsQ
VTATKNRPKKKPSVSKIVNSKTASKREDVHPKISERRQGVAKDKSRRRSQTIFTLGFISMAAVIALAVLASPLFNVAEVQAAGHVRTDPGKIIAVSGVAIGSQLTDVDTSAVAEAVMNSSAWIESVQVDRSWNGVITIYVVERTPVLAVPIQADGSRLMLVDATGRQLEAISIEEANLPSGVMPVEGLEVNGIAGQPSGVETLRAGAIMKGLSDEVRSMAAALQVTDGLVSLLTPDGAKISFGDERLLEEKVIAVETLFARVDMRCLHEIDVRVPAAPTVTRKSIDGQPRAIVNDLSQCV